jgi:hypothetical protein
MQTVPRLVLLLFNFVLALIVWVMEVCVVVVKMFL